MTSATRPALAAAALFGLTLALLTAALGAPAQRRYDIGAPGDAYVALNFYRTERDGAATYRWSGPNALALLPDPSAGTVILSARLHGNPRRSPLSLTPASSSAAPLTIQPDTAWRTYRLLVPHDRIWDGSGQIAGVRLDTASSGPQANDPRELGVAIDWLEVTPLSGAPGPIGGPLRRALPLAWAIALVAVGCFLSARALFPRRPAAPMAWAVIGLAVLLVTALGLWAWRDSASLAWALPLSLPGLAAASLALLTLWVADGWLQGTSRPHASRGGAWVALAAVAAAAHLLALLPVAVGLRGLGSLVIVALPGALLSRLVLRDEGDPLAILFLGLCGGLALQVPLLLALQIWPGSTGAGSLLALCDIQSGLVALALWRRPAPPPDPARSIWPHPTLPLGGILLIAAALRLPFLGRAELHDDEATAMIAAARVVHGAPNELLLQLKGPLQALLPVGPLALTGQINEWVARLPFFAAGMGVVLGGYLLGRRFVGRDDGRVGLAVALILALDGFLIAFSRIVQYQSVVMLMGLGALWCCWSFYRGEGRPAAQLGVGAALMAVGLLSHYDAIYVAPALAWLVIAGGVRRGWRPRDWVAALSMPIVLGAALLAIFYVPFVLHPHFSQAAAHVGERSGQLQGGASWSLYNNLPGSYALATFYNSAPAVWAAIAALGLTLAAALALYTRPRPLGYTLAAALLVVCADLLRGQASLLMAGPGLLAALAIGLPIAVLALSPATPISLRAPLIWFGGACVAVSFLLEQPRTHMHVMDVPAALLVGCAVAAVGRSARPAAAALRPAMAGLGAALLLLGAPYAYALFVRQEPEYQRGFPMAALAGYPALSAEPAAAPIGGSGRLGYPAHDGWKVVGELYRRGELRGPFASNQSKEVTQWYSRGVLRCGATPDYYMIATSLMNPAFPQGYHLLGIVQAAGSNRMLIYSRSDPGAPARTFDSAAYADAFDAQPVPALPTDEVFCGQASGATP